MNGEKSTLYSCLPYLCLCFAVPSAPQNPRIFVLPSGKYHNQNEVVVEFRWNKPKHENGVLTRFEILYRISNQTDTNETFEDWIAVNAAPSEMSCQLEGMSPGYTIAFQVCMKAGKRGSQWCGQKVG